jgi:hypothetical protein
VGGAVSGAVEGEAGGGFERRRHHPMRELVAKFLCGEEKSEREKLLFLY